jgi:DNA-binding MarR family transcriptional regulator
MNKERDKNSAAISAFQLEQFQDLINRLYQCCQERMQYQSDRFNLPDAELRCLLLFAEERYLTPKGIALKMHVVKSRITKIIDGLIRKGLVQRIKDPEDSRIHLLSLTTKGQKKSDEVNAFLNDVHRQVLSRITPQQRSTLLINLDLLKSSMEAVTDSLA